MNKRAVWRGWKARRNTAEIARQLKGGESEVDRIISQRLSEEYLKREKPFGKGAS